MVVKIRLARFGRTNQPVYNIVVAQARSARGSKPMEVLGTYDPIPRPALATHAPDETRLDPKTGIQKIMPKKPYKAIVLDTIRTKYWLGVGAQPSEPVERLFSMMGLVEKKPKKTKTNLASPAYLATLGDSSSSGSSTTAAATPTTTTTTTIS